MKEEKSGIKPTIETKPVAKKASKKPSSPVNDTKLSDVVLPEMSLDDKVGSLYVSLSHTSLFNLLAPRVTNLKVEGREGGLWRRIGSFRLWRGITKTIVPPSPNPPTHPSQPAAPVRTVAQDALETAKIIATESAPASNPSTDFTPKPDPMAMQGHFNEFAPRICVIGVGGAGGNAVNNMIARNLSGVDFLAINTDAQHLSTTLTDNRLQIGRGVTAGLGCGANPDAGRLAAEESKDEILDLVGDNHMVFITAGMGGGTGTGAASVVADLCYKEGILTVGVVTKPFRFEGTHRMRLADEGVGRLQDCVDTMIVIPNQNLFQMVDPKVRLDVERSTGGA